MDERDTKTARGDSAPIGGATDLRARTEARRAFLRRLAGGAAVSALGAWWFLDDRLTRRALAQRRPDGRPRLPPGQRVLSALRPMGGQAGDPRASAFRLRVYGEVDSPFELDLASLMAIGQDEQSLDVHCVTGWSVLGARFRGLPMQSIAERAGIRPAARHVIFEAAYGYTANVPLRDALAPDSLIAHALDGRSLPRIHGGPARAVVPSLYFWKSAKWITGVRFSARDEPGYWETRGYHNYGDPWREQRYG